jgi:hypothetical protein
MCFAHYLRSYSCLGSGVIEARLSAWLSGKRMVDRSLPWSSKDAMAESRLEVIRYICTRVAELILL